MNRKTPRGSFHNRKVLVTGGLGFIGLNLSHRLLEHGADLTVMDHFVPPRMLPFLERIGIRPKVAIADIRDEEKVERLVQGQEVIFNLAGKSGAAQSNQAPMIDLDVNCRGHLTLLEACRRCNPEASIIFPSSRLVYGKPRSLPVGETHPLQPESIYAAHKLAVENYHLIYTRLYGLKAVVLRISNPYGPMQTGDVRSYGIANRFIQAAARGEKITIFGDGGQQRDYLYIEDLVQALLLAGEHRDAAGRIYNIGDHHTISLLQLAELAVRTAGAGEIIRVPWPPEYAAIETGDYHSDIRLAKRELGWSPKTVLEEGIAATVSFYRHWQEPAQERE